MLARRPAGRIQQAETPASDPNIDPEPPDGVEWAQQAWPTERDSEEQRRAKKRQLEKLLHVRVAQRDQAKKRRAEPSAHAAPPAARSGSNGRLPLALSQPSEGAWRKTSKRQHADRKRQRKERLFGRRSREQRDREEEEAQGPEDVIQSADGASTAAAAAAAPSHAAPAALQPSVAAPAAAFGGAAGGCAATVAQEQGQGATEPAGCPLAAVPCPSGEAPPLHGELATPLAARVLPGPGQETTQQQQQRRGSAVGRAAAGSTHRRTAIATGGDSSGGIPTLPSGRRPGGRTSVAASLPALLGANAAVASGRPLLSAVMGSLPSQPPSVAAASGPVRGRRAWQQTQRSNPLHLLRNAAPSQQQHKQSSQAQEQALQQQQQLSQPLQRSGWDGALGPERHTVEEAPGAAAAAAAREEAAAGELPNPAVLLLGLQAAQAEQQAPPHREGERQAAPNHTQQQLQQEQQQVEQQTEQGVREGAGQVEEQPQQQQQQAAADPPSAAAEQHGSAAAQPHPAQLGCQPGVQHQQQQVQQQHATGAAAGRGGSAAPRPRAATLGTGTDWGSLPPTPSCMYAFSPDPPAVPAAAGGAAMAAGRQPAAFGTDARSCPAATPAVAAAPGRAGSSAAATPAVAGAPAVGGSGAAATAPWLQHASYVAETPVLLSSPGQGAGLSNGQQAAQQLAGAEGGGGRQLFIAETPACAVAPPGVPPAAPELLLASACTPAAAAAAAGSPAAGLQLHLPQPVLHAAPAADGRHLALLLGSYAPAGEPTDVLVLRLPERAPSAPPPLYPPSAATAGAAAAPCPSPRGGPDASGVRVVASLAVQRSRWAEGLELTPNCLQLGVDGRAGLRLILSAALELAEQPPPQQPSILVLQLPAAANGADNDGESGGAGRGGPAAGGRAAAPDATAPAPAQRGSGGSAAVLAVEHAAALTCVLLDGPSSLLAAGDGGEVRRLEFGPLWRTYTWGRSLPPAAFKGVHFEDVQQLLAYRCPASGRRLLAGLSSHGAAAVWDMSGNVLLMARADARHRLRRLQPVGPAAAGLAAAARQPPDAPADACPAPAPPQLFLGLVESRGSGEQRVAAVVLSPAGLAISGGSLLAPVPGGQAQRRPLRRQEPAAADATALGLAGGRCWVGNAAGHLVECCAAGGEGGSGGATAPPPLRCYRAGAGAVTSLWHIPAGGDDGGGDGGGREAAGGGSSSWRLVAATAGGTCTVLAR